MRESMRYPLLVDGRNLYDPAEMVAKGFFYQAIGRPQPETSTTDQAAAAAQTISSPIRAA
jgi:UDPglucose 6-dehydrogenase